MRAHITLEQSQPVLDLPAPFRAATRADAPALAELVNFASEGLALHVWSKLAAPDADAWQLGRERASRETGSFSYRNAVVAQAGGRTVAALLGYRLPDTPEPVDPNTLPPLFVPLQELENLVPGTWYVNVLAAYPAYRGKGYGTALLGLAGRLAQASGSRGLSIIVSDGNTGARRLYERRGYREAARRPMVESEWQGTGSNWLLLVKPRNA
jgi:ribosomal protein S18 acetylase RimI-like enzyme